MNMKYEVRIYLPGHLAYVRLKSKGFCWRFPNFSVHLIFRKVYQATDHWVLFLGSGPGWGWALMTQPLLQKNCSHCRSTVPIKFKLESKDRVSCQRLADLN